MAEIFDTCCHWLLNVQSAKALLYSIYTYCPEVRLPFADHMTENCQIMNVQVRGPLPGREGGKNRGSRRKPTRAS